MKVLVAYATKHGATRGIAERIGSTLERHGLEVTVASVKDVRETDTYDAFVVGSAAYMFHWMKEAKQFVARHRSVLAAKPTWIFSSGPLGTDLVDKEGKDVRAAAEPKEFAELRPTLLPRGEHIFWGAYDPDAAPIGVAEWFIKKAAPAKDGLPAGDFRDWEEIDAWADEIASALVPALAPA